MDREEPHFGKPDLSDLEFRPRSYRGPSHQPTASASNNLSVWKLALGIFLGLSAFGVGVLIFLGFTAQSVVEEQERREKAAAEQLKKALGNPDPLGWRAQAAADHAKQAAQAARLREAARLLPGERCIQGRRFKRVENGWVQIPHRPCQ